MPNNKLKDNEIIKALEEYVKENEFEYFHSNTMGEYPLIRKALNFINRLQAQNKDLAETTHNLIIEKDALFDKTEELKAEVERLEKETKDKERAYNDEFCLRKEWKTKCQELLEEKQTAKSEAVKEFAERLKENISDDCRIVSDEGEYVGYDCDDVMYCINNLVKEFERKENTTYDD